MRTRILEDPDKFRNDFCIHPFRFGISLMTCAACLILAIPFLMVGEPAGTVLLLVICALFARQAFIYGPFVSITEEGVRKHIFGHTLCLRRWDEIGEIGVVGTKVFNRLNPDKTGYLYIYFSPEKLNDEKRFQLALRFPPKNMIFLLHNKEREDLIQMFWSTRIVGYYVGRLKLRRDPGDTSSQEPSAPEQKE